MEDGVVASFRNEHPETTDNETDEFTPGFPLETKAGFLMQRWQYNVNIL
jgi:hypothetical protein